MRSTPNWPTASPMDELLLVQERRDLEAELEAMSNTIDMSALEDAFVGVAKSYSASKKHLLRELARRRRRRPACSSAPASPAPPDRRCGSKRIRTDDRITHRAGSRFAIARLEQPDRTASREIEGMRDDRIQPVFCRT